MILLAKILVTVLMVTVLVAAACIIEGFSLAAGAVMCLIAGAGLVEIWRFKK